jgi:predicted Na+-dependent transporter
MNDEPTEGRVERPPDRDWTPHVLALIVTFGFFALLGYLAVRPVPAESKDVLNIMLGSLASGWVSIVSYYFGASLGSAPAPKRGKD